MELLEERGVVGVVEELVEDGERDVDGVDDGGELGELVLGEVEDEPVELLEEKLGLEVVVLLVLRLGLLDVLEAVAELVAEGFVVPVYPLAC